MDNLYRLAGLLIILLASLAGHVLADPVVTDQRATFDITIRGDIYLSSSDINDLQLKYSFYPKNTLYQTVQSFRTTPRATTRDNHLLFTWEKPATTETYQINAVVESRITHPKVVTKVSYPIAISSELKNFTLPTEEVDSDNPDIQQLAKNLRGDSDDLFEITFRLANWTENNIDYNKSTLTADISQKASWVLENRQGVCDELTNLFIALCRSLGIPARFVSGIAYTDSPLFDYSYGPHAWAEVYFPDTGWVPFDISYQQYGFVDATHIVMSDSDESKSSASEAIWKSAGNGNAVISKPKFTVAERAVFPADDQKLSIRLMPVKEEVGPGSYNAVVAEIENRRGYYQIIELHFVPTENIEFDALPRHLIMMKPFEVRRIAMLMKVPEELDPQYTYTFPIQATIPSLVNASTQFNVSHYKPTFDKQDLILIKPEKQSDEQLNLYCYSTAYQLQINHVNNISCILKSINSHDFAAVKVCIQDSCKNISLAHREHVQLDLSYSDNMPGYKEIIVIATAGNITKTATVPVELLDVPEVRIEEINYPKKLTYGDHYNISFLLNTTSFASAHSVMVFLNSSSVNNFFEVGSLNKLERIFITLNSVDLDQPENRFILTIRYSDLQGTEYVKSEIFTIKIINSNFLQRIQMMLLRVGRRLSAIVHKSYISLT